MRFSESVKRGRDSASRPQLSRLERGFCAASDFDTDCVMQGYLHPFIYRAASIPDALWFWEFIGASETAQPVRETFAALRCELGAPGQDGYGDAVFRVAESSPEWRTRFEAWDEAHSISPGWADLFDLFLERHGTDPHAFWHA